MLDFIQDAWSQSLYPALESSWPIVIVLALVGFAMRYSGVANPYIGLRESLSKTALEALKHTFDQIGRSLRLDSPENHAESISKHLSKVFKDFHLKADGLLFKSIENVRGYAKETIGVFGDNNHKCAWRIAGAVITAALLGMFVMADVIQAAFSLSEITGFSAITNRFLRNYPILDNLPLSIMISSVGTTATLAFILVDLLGITKFIPWEDAPLWGEKSIKDRLRPWVIRLIVMTIFVSSLFAFSRLQAFRFNFPLVNDIVAIVPFAAQILILIPMFATTVFLSYGVMVVYIFFLIVLGLLQLLLLGIRGVFFLLAGLLSSIEPASTPAVGLFLAIFLVVIIILAMMTGVVLMVADSVFFLVEFIFVTIFGVFRWIANRISRLFIK
jgi:hypothetical protein